jgi:hypothetical protein
MRTQADLIAEIRELVDDPTAYPIGRYTDVEIRRWINNGARDVARQTQCLRDFTQVNAVADQRKYVLSGSLNIIGVHKIEYVVDSQTYPLTYMDPYNADRSRGIYRERSGFWPSYWTSWDTPPSLTIEIFPATTTSTGTLDIYFYRHPADLATASTADQAQPIDLPSGWEEAPVLFAAARAMMKDRNMQGYETFMAEYAMKVRELEHVATRYTDQGGGGIILRPEMESGIWGSSY